MFDKKKDYFELRLVSTDGMRIPVNCSEGNGSNMGFKTHCIFGWLSPTFFSLDKEEADS